MICNSKIHSKSCPSYRNNSLKSASAVSQHADKKLVLNQNEISILSKVLRMSQIYITKNKDQFQSKDILNEINQSLQILNSSNQLKGASSNICSKQSLMNIKNMVGLI